MNEVSARLVIRQGPHPSEEHVLRALNTIIGRSHTSDVIIGDPEVSRHHAQITRQGDTFVLEDLDSTNGTFLNGQRVTAPSPLNAGDLIDLGATIRLEFLPTIAASDPSSSRADAEDYPHALAPEPAGSSVMVPSQPRADLGFARKSRSRRRRWMIGCGCGLLLIVFLCGATLFFLDAYEGGRLLYCGPLQPLFESILGPVGFSPACAAP